VKGGASVLAYLRGEPVPSAALGSEATAQGAL